MFKTYSDAMALLGFTPVGAEPRHPFERYAFRNAAGIVVSGMNGPQGGRARLWSAWNGDKVIRSPGGHITLFNTPMGAARRALREWS